jgi:predicted MFS family arabinose efflux permease
LSQRASLLYWYKEAVSFTGTKEGATAPLLTTDKFRWDRLTYASALGYALLVCALSVGVVLGELREQFALSGLIASLHGSTFGFGLLVAGVWGVRVVDSLGRRSALALSAAALASGITLFCTGPAWPITLTGTALAGLGGALLVMVMPGLISDHHGEHRAAAFAAVNGAPGLAGVAFSLIIGLALALHWSWRAPYLILTGVIVLALISVAWPVAIPKSPRQGAFTLSHFRDRDVFVPWLHIVNAVICEFAIGIWAATYLKEVGNASGGLASAMAGVFGISMFLSRLVLPTIMRYLGDATITVSFTVLAVGALMMCFAPGLLPRVAGLTIVGFGGAPLYPLTVDRLYASAEHKIDSISLGAICALASGAAVTLGPLALGILADSVGLQRALLVVPVIAVVGAITQRPARSTGLVAAALD